MADTSPSLPKESSGTHAAVSLGSPGAADTEARRRTASREQSSRPAPSKEPFRTRSSPNAIPPASGSVCAPAPSGTRGRLSPAFVRSEKRREAPPLFPPTPTTDNEILRQTPQEQTEHP